MNITIEVNGPELMSVLANGTLAAFAATVNLHNAPDIPVSQTAGKEKVTFEPVMESIKEAVIAGPVEVKAPPAKKSKAKAEPAPEVEPEIPGQIEIPTVAKAEVVEGEYTYDEVRARMMEAQAKGLGMKALLTEFSTNSLTSLPKTSYPALLRRITEMEEGLNG